MMDYAAFKNEVKNRLADYMPAGMMGRKVEFVQVDKVNRTMDGICIGGRSLNRKATCSPVIFINDMYEIYRKCGDFGAAISMSLLHMQQAEQADIGMLWNLETARENIVFQMINTEQNRNMLCKVPHRKFLDLSVIYRWMPRMDENGIISAVVSNDLADELGLSERELFGLAKENTSRILPPVVKPVGDAVRTLMEPGIADTMPGMDQAGIWVITNNRCFNGAVYVLYEDEIHGLAERLGADLHIMPSSIHEMMAVPVWMDPHALADMISSLNRICVPAGERLSNNVYRYDRKSRKIVQEVGMPSKGLEKLGKLWGVMQ